MFERVEQFRHIHDTTSGALIGYAAPAGGHRPAAVALCAADTVIHVAQASRFSDTAFRKGKRLGWCGFHIPSPGRAFALSSDVALKCHASGRVLSKVGRNVLSSRVDAITAMSVIDLLRRVRRETDASQVSEIMDFALAHYRQHGVEAFVQASYRMLLGRPAESEAIRFWSSRQPSSSLVYDLLAALVESSEFRADPRNHIPGPFHPDFQFTLSPLA